jgi:excisionase family DNA binding protein
VQPQRDPSQRLLSPADAATMFGVRRPRIYELVRRQAIMPIRIGRLLRFRLDDLEAFLAKGGETAHSDAGTEVGGTER